MAGWTMDAGVMRIVYIPATDPNNEKTLDVSASLHQIHIIYPDKTHRELISWGEF